MPDFYTAVSNRPIISILMKIEHWWNDNWQEKAEFLGEKPVPGPF
jgi:hypothetical protein